MIFSYLNLKDLLNLRIVNKNLNYVISNVRMMKICFIASDLHFADYQGWKEVFNKINCEIQFEKRKIEILKFNIFDLSKINELSIKVLEDSDNLTLFDIGRKFVNLRKLTIYLDECENHKKSSIIFK